MSKYTLTQIATAMKLQGITSDKAHAVLHYMVVTSIADRAVGQAIDRAYYMDERIKHDGIAKVKVRP